jgi:hypothetical protein
MKASYVGVTLLNAVSPPVALTLRGSLARDISSSAKAASLNGPSSIISD